MMMQIHRRRVISQVCEVIRLMTYDDDDDTDDDDEAEEDDDDISMGRYFTGL